MPPTSVDVTKYIIGSAQIYYRATGVLTDWTSVGLTMDDAVAKIGFANSNPSDALNGIDGAIRGLDYMRVKSAEIEFTLPELSATKLALAIPGSVATAGSVADATVTPFTSTLAAASAIGDTSVKITALTNLTAGDFVRIDVTAGSLAEYRQITTVGTIGAGGTGAMFRDPLLKAHANGVAIVESLGDGKTEITPPLVRRAPLTVYNDWALVTQSPADYYEVLLYRAIAVSDAVQLSFNDDGSKPAGIRVVLSARKDETNLSLPLIRLRTPIA
jgi:hypothetical protein